ncbi:MAG: LysR substrate-binding domain-containing protein [Pseudomonadales bacterium]|nr:LysR substrate-binding domain-containing protein [Pseudomonadales bacterium]
MISIKQINYALAVEKTLHFKKAAEACNISQSALSTALNEMEKQLGIQIFERDNKKVLITPLGQEVLDRSRQIMLQIEDLQHLAEHHQKPLSFPLTIGVIPTIAPYLLPKIFPVLNDEYPQAQLNIVEEQSHVLVDMVRKGEIDTAILALPYPIDGLLSIEFFAEDFYWVACKGDQFTELKEVTSNELTQSNLMLLKEGHCLKDHILDACKLPDQTANHGFGATSLSTLIQMVLGKLGTTLVPEMALEQLISQNQDLTAIHLNEPGPHRRVAFIFRPNYTRLSSIELIAETCRKALA